MIKLTILGTSGSAPTKERNLSGMALQFDGNLFLFDCGEGTQRQMFKYGLNISKLKAVFITHMHGDHVIGIAGLARTLSLYKRTAPLTIFVPHGFEENAKMLIKFDNATFTYEIIVKGVKGGKILSGDGFEIRAFALRHSVMDYGYIFKESDKWHFMKQKCKELGVKGDMFKKLEKMKQIALGKKTVRFKDVTTFELGKKIVYATDTRPAKSTIKAAEGADVLLHESTYDDAMAKLAKERMHSTSGEAAKVAKDAKVKKLILFHFSTRYKNTEELLKDAKSVFPESYLANDGMQIDI